MCTNRNRELEKVFYVIARRSAAQGSQRNWKGKRKER